MAITTPVRKLITIALAFFIRASYNLNVLVSGPKLWNARLEKELKTVSSMGPYRDQASLRRLHERLSEPIVIIWLPCAP